MVTSTVYAHSCILVWWPVSSHALSFLSGSLFRQVVRIRPHRNLHWKVSHARPLSGTVSVADPDEDRPRDMYWGIGKKLHLWHFGVICHSHMVASGENKKRASSPHSSPSKLLHPRFFWCHQFLPSELNTQLMSFFLFYHIIECNSESPQLVDTFVTFHDFYISGPKHRESPVLLKCCFVFPQNANLFRGPHGVCVSSCNQFLYCFRIYLCM